MNTSSVRYLTFNEVFELHEKSLDTWGGGVGGFHNKNALESAIALPQTFVFGEERFPSLPSKAAAYCWFIAKGHPFLQGNKRTALAAAYTFLFFNGIIPQLDQNAAYETVCKVAAGTIELDELTLFFEAASRSYFGPAK